jgi:hypothetical protein
MGENRHTKQRIIGCNCMELEENAEKTQRGFSLFHFSIAPRQNFYTLLKGNYANKEKRMRL